jgi:hypothetical protein
MPGARSRRERFLQFLDFWPHDVVAMVEHALDACIDVALERLVLGP